MNGWCKEYTQSAREAATVSADWTHWYDEARFTRCASEQISTHSSAQVYTHKVHGIREK